METCWVEGDQDSDLAVIWRYWLMWRKTREACCQVVIWFLEEPGLGDLKGELHRLGISTARLLHKPPARKDLGIWTWHPNLTNQSESEKTGFIYFTFLNNNNHTHTPFRYEFFRDISTLLILCISPCTLPLSSDNIQNGSKSSPTNIATWPRK